MINLTINRDDYADYNVFMSELKKALRYKGNSFSKLAVGTMNTDNVYKSILPDYLYYRLFDDLGNELEGNYTHYITIEQIGGSGGYFFKEGLFRKQSKPVNFKVFPPTNMYVTDVTYNENKLTESFGEYSFTMPNEDVNVKIYYSLTMPETSTVYWGISSTPNVSNIVSSGYQLQVQLNKEFAIPFNNLGNSGYIWFATELPVALQSAEAFKESKFLIGGTFNTTPQEELPNYVLYVHKWPTEINKINFYNE